MRGKRYIIASGIVAFSLLVALFFVLDFRGNLDPGQFEILRTAQNSEKKYAIVAKRSDHEALNGDQYFVLLSDTIYSSNELRVAFHRSPILFSADRDGIEVRWTSPNELVIECQDCGISKTEINTRQSRAANVSIHYVNFPED
jgi:hypothetical protein